METIGTTDKLLNMVESDFEAFDLESEELITKMTEASKTRCFIIPEPDNFTHIKLFGLDALELDFLSRLKTGNMITADQYSKHVDKYFLPPDYLKLAKHEDVFYKIENKYYKDSAIEPIDEDPEVTLEKWAGKHPTLHTVEYIDELLDKIG